MKKLKLSNPKRYFFIGAFILSAAFIVGCEKDNDEPVQNAMYTVTGTANGSQINPPVEGTGAATFNGNYDSLNQQLIFTTNWSNLSGPPTYASFYSGQSGSAGDTLGTAWTFDPTVTATGSITDTITLTNEQMDQLLDGNWYYMINTGINNTGEVRGQLTAIRQ